MTRPLPFAAVLAVLVAAPLAGAHAAESMPETASPHCREVTILVNQGGNCYGGRPCTGVTVIVGGRNNCRAGPGQDACSGTVTVHIATSGNCRGGDGRPGEAGGDACTGTTVNVLAHRNCVGGDGGAGGDLL